MLFEVVKNAYTIETPRRPEGDSLGLPDGGLQAFVDEEETTDSIFVPIRDELVSEGVGVSVVNLPVECRQFWEAEALGETLRRRSPWWTRAQQRDF